ncbi:MAG: 3',5'-cyclic-nucleotide phosphodiesterase [Gemmataceae bacterium]|nr:3',5'-cyclic-nucleotide phosphodiesterase [Gemmataceae bacterium]
MTGTPVGPTAMRVTILPASTSGQPLQLFTTYLVDGVLAIDAGSLGLWGTAEEQARVKHVFLTHAHLDHIASLPPWLDAVYDGSGDCPVVHGPAHTLECLKQDVFNNRLFPDFLHISTIRPPYLKLAEAEPGKPMQAGRFKVTPVAVDHVVPTVGYVVEDEEGAAVFPSDTAPTEEIWKVAAATGKPLTVFLECTFPESMAWLAGIAKHLTPSLFAAETRKLGKKARWVTVHVHPRHRATVLAELEALGVEGVEEGKFGVAYAV